MKSLLLIIFLSFAMKCSGQTVEKQIDDLKKKNTLMQTSISQLNAALVKMIVLYAEKDKKIEQLSDSMRVLKESIPAIVQANQKVTYITGAGITKANDSTYIIK